MAQASQVAQLQPIRLSPAPVQSQVRRAGRETEGVKYQWVVLQRRPLSDLPPWKRWLVRYVYRLVDWQTADGEEKQAICETEAVAKAICAAGGPNWFYHRLPVNATLPAQTCKLDGVRFPQSEASEFYEGIGRDANAHITVVCPFSGEECHQHDSLNLSELKTLYERSRSAASS